MDVSKIKVELRKLSEQPLEILDRKSQETLFKTVQSCEKKIAQIREKAELQRLEATIPLEDRQLLALLVKELGPRKKDPDQVAAAVRRCKELAGRLRPQVQKLRQMDEASALRILQGLAPADRLHLSLLANVTNSQGKLLKLSSAKKNQQEWWKGLHLK